jgi:hypothetical protein
MVKQLLDRSWRWRRWAVFSQLAICDAAIVYIVFLNSDSVLHRDAFGGLVLLIGAIINGYVFGAVLDDRNRDKAVAETDGSFQTETTTTKISAPAAPDPSKPPAGFAE